MLDLKKFPSKSTIRNHVRTLAKHIINIVQFSPCFQTISSLKIEIKRQTASQLINHLHLPEVKRTEFFNQNQRVEISRKILFKFNLNSL